MGRYNWLFWASLLICIFSVEEAKGLILQEEEVAALAYEIAPQYKVDPDLVTAMAYVESSFNSKAIGRSHKEVGLMQLHPKYFRASFDPRLNVEMAVIYLSKLRRICKPKYKDAWFVCYNTGPNRQIENPKDTKYYKKVKAKYVEIKNNRRTVAQH